MSENQETMMKKITIMEKWIKKNIKDDDKIVMSGKERSDFWNGIHNVSEAKKRAEGILKYMQRGQVFDMPKELEE